MDLGKVMTALLGSLLIGFCLVAAVLYLLPLYQKIQLDQLCRDYGYAANANEGLSAALRQELAEELAASGLREVAIRCPQEGELGWRQRERLVVTGKLSFRVASGFLTFEEQQVDYEFSAWVFGKRIVN